MHKIDRPEHRPSYSIEQPTLRPMRIAYLHVRSALCCYSIMYRQPQKKRTFEDSEAFVILASLSFKIHEHEEHFKRMNVDSLMHSPEFVIKPRSHTVWEKQCVRLHCTVSGWPDPRVVW